MRNSLSYVIRTIFRRLLTGFFLETTLNGGVGIPGKPSTFVDLGFVISDAENPWVCYSSELPPSFDGFFLRDDVERRCKDPQVHDVYSSISDS